MYKAPIGCPDTAHRGGTMRLLAAALLTVSAVVVACSAGPDPEREIDNVAAFARLYGVARYFYPSDAAAELDWNWFAVHGVAQVRPARDSSSLRDTLTRLFAPLGPGIEVGRELPAPPPSTGSGEPLVAWRYLGAGFSSGRGPYRAKRTHRGAPPPGSEGFATLMQMTPGTEKLKQTGLSQPLPEMESSFTEVKAGRPSMPLSIGPIIWLSFLMAVFISLKRAKERSAKLIPTVLFRLWPETVQGPIVEMAAPLSKPV